MGHRTKRHYRHMACNWESVLVDRLHKHGMTFAAVLVAAAVALSLCGCTTSRPYTKGERIAFGCAVAGQAWDMGSTYTAIYHTDNLAEANPLWSDLDDGELMASMFVTKAALIGAAYLIGEWRPSWRIGLWSVVGLGGAIPGASNTYLINEQ